MSMEKLVSLVRVGLTKELIVKCLYLRIVVRLAKNLSLVLGVERLCSLFLVGLHNVGILVGKEALSYVGLTAAVYTTAGTSHYFDEVILARSCADLVKENLCVLHSVSNSYVYGHTAEIKACFLDSVKASYSLELNSVMLFSGESVMSSSESRLHNAAGYTEDNACAGVFTNDIVVEFLVGKLCEVDTASLDELAELASSKNCIYVCESVCLESISLLPRSTCRGVES